MSDEMKTVTEVPKKMIGLWGRTSEPAFLYLSKQLGDRGFAGPLTWKDANSIPFLFDATEDIRINLSVSRCGVEGRFDSTIVLRSKTIFRKTVDSDPWAGHGGQLDPWHIGSVACLAARLSHEKWKQEPAPINPSWLMTLEDAALPNVAEWLADFDALQLPLINSLKSDEALADVMAKAIDYTRPGWVKSDGPGFVSIRELLAALGR